METNTDYQTPQPESRSTVTTVLFILATLLLFLFALDLMISSVHHLGKDSVQTIIQATSNPFTGLFIGLLITAMIQSSSTTTAMAVALVASGSLSIQSAVPLIMGANVGTTITAIIVSFGFMGKNKEFKRAVAAGSYHSFFNIITVLILFPLEYTYGFLSSSSVSIGSYFFSAIPETTGNAVLNFGPGLDPMIEIFLRIIPSGILLMVISFILLFSSILLFRKLISDLLQAKSPEAFSRFFFKNQVKSFIWGVLTTAAIRSSTITSSVVVTIVAKKIATLRQAAPFIMGANIGTTITAFIAAILNPDTQAAISIAIAHFLFNVFGVLMFFPIPALRKLLVEISSRFGQLAMQNRSVGFIFILLIFFIIPFGLIFFNRG